MWETHGLGGDTHFRNLLGSWSPEKGRERASLPSTLGGKLHINGKGQIGAATVTQVPTSVEVSFNPLLLPLPTYCCFENGTHHQSLSLEGVCNVTTLLAKTRLIRVPGPQGELVRKKELNETPPPAGALWGQVTALGAP